MIKSEEDELHSTTIALHNGLHLFCKSAQQTMETNMSERTQVSWHTIAILPNDDDEDGDDDGDGGADDDDDGVGGIDDNEDDGHAGVDDNDEGGGDK